MAGLHHHCSPSLMLVNLCRHGSNIWCGEENLLMPILHMINNHIQFKVQMSINFWSCGASSSLSYIGFLLYHLDASYISRPPLLPRVMHTASALHTSTCAYFLHPLFSAHLSSLLLSLFSSPPPFIHLPIFVFPSSLLLHSTFPRCLVSIQQQYHRIPPPSHTRAPTPPTISLQPAFVS